MTAFVVDASVLVSAAVAVEGSPSARLLAAVTAGEVEIVACEKLLDEIERTLRTRYFASRLPPDGAETFRALVQAAAIICQTRPPAASREGS